jgi:hypothetical protein
MDTIILILKAVTTQKLTIELHKDFSKFEVEWRP